MFNWSICHHQMEVVCVMSCQSMFISTFATSLLWEEASGVSMAKGDTALQWMWGLLPLGPALPSPLVWTVTLGHVFDIGGTALQCKWRSPLRIVWELPNSATGSCLTAVELLSELDSGLSSWLSRYDLYVPRELCALIPSSSSGGCDWSKWYDLCLLSWEWHWSSGNTVSSLAAPCCCDSQLAKAFKLCCR